jgi:adenine-specific DNA-methyltransferase
MEKIDLEKTEWRSSQEFFQGLEDELRALDSRDEAYNFTWVGKRKSIIEAGAPINKTLRPAVDESKNWDTTENLFIEGDNLDALKLLQESYLGKIKMIYIDPPYNTGKDFVYHDNFTADNREYAVESGKKDTEGNTLIAEDEFAQNNRSNGRFHSDWLSMIYPRLKLARNLLTDDGVIFISIDDNEQANLKKVCDEVFGEDNFVGQWNWFKSATPPNLSKKIKKNLEYILSYQKGHNDGYFKGILKTSKSDDPFTKPQNSIKQLVFPPKSINTKLDNGIYTKGIYGTEKFPNELLEDLVILNGTNINAAVFSNKFIWLQSKLDEELQNGTRISLSKQLVLSYKKAEYGEEVPPNLIDENVGVDTTENAGSELALLFDKHKVFDYPKPVSLLKYLINMVCETDDLILDFFAGSGTTAHAVMKLNAEDSVERKFILVQLPEATPENSEAREAGYQTIADISKERIRRAGEQLKIKNEERKNKSAGQFQFADENQKSSIQNPKLDIGFRVLKIDTANEREEIRRPVDLYEQATLRDDVENIKKERTPLDLFYGVLVHSALPYNLPIESEQLTVNSGQDLTTLYKYDYQGEGTGLVACFAEELPEEVIKHIIALKPLTAVFRESSFRDSQAKINLTEMFKTNSGETKIKIV